MVLKIDHAWPFFDLLSGVGVKGRERPTSNDHQDSFGQLIGNRHLCEKAIVSGMIAVDVIQAIDDQDRATPRSSELDTRRIELVGDLLTELGDVVARQLAITCLSPVRIQHDDHVMEKRLRRATRSCRRRARNVGVVAENPVGAACQRLTQKRGFPGARRADDRDITTVMTRNRRLQLLDCIGQRPIGVEVDREFVRTA